MLCYKENYGSDADGNRGVAVVEYEIEASDEHEVIEKLYDLFLEGETGTQIINMYCCITDEDVEIEVEIDDYIEKLIERADADEDIKDDEDMQEMLGELKQEIKNTKCCKILMEYIEKMEASIKEVNGLRRDCGIIAKVDLSRIEQGLVDVQEQVEKIKGEQDAKNN